MPKSVIFFAIAYVLLIIVAGVMHAAAHRNKIGPEL
jgi:hypothetical protein